MLRGEEKFAGEGAFGGAAGKSLFGGNFYDIGIIVFLRNVRKNQIARATVETFWIGEVFAHGMIRKMASTRKHTLLHDPRVRTNF